jgi:1-acyl-sn-glycerol-3-phosphate acyltransferase
MRGLVAAWRIVRALLHVGHGIAVVALGWRRLDAHGRHARISWWAAKLLRLLGVAVQANGGLRSGATLLVANHVSWLDILAVHAVCPQAHFVSKAEVRHWPVLGWLIGAVGTLFIERERKRDALRVVHQVADALRGGQTVAVFPEGTTSDGRALLPFHANLLQAAIATAMPVQPVALRYAEPGQRFSPAACWIGEATLLGSLWAIARARGLAVHVHALPPVATAHADRRALAGHLRELIGDALQPPMTVK